MENIDWDLLSSYAGLLTLATVSIYAGAFGSLPNPPRKAKDESKVTLQDDDDDEEEDVERVSAGDAWLFPVMGSATLFGLYMVIKVYGTTWINWFLGWYFSLMGVGSVWKTLVSFARFTVGGERWKKFERIRVMLVKGPREVTAISARTPTLLLLPLSLLPSYIYSFSDTQQKSVLVTDILGLSFCYNALSMLKIDSFKTGCILLTGLFFYDVYWVFGTEVMVKVATNLDVPIKLLWPKALDMSSSRGFTMLGLGDVVIPGTFIALALRYDRARSSGKAYFYATLSAYVAGLATTMGVMHVWGRAQPALLYLSPMCMLAFVVTGMVRGEIREAWCWVDA